MTRIKWVLLKQFQIVISIYVQNIYVPDINIKQGQTAVAIFLTQQSNKSAGPLNVSSDALPSHS